jgi:hypothetical protein
MLVEQVKIFIGEWEHEPGEEGEFFGFEEEINKWLKFYRGLRDIYRDMILRLKK